jgi:hypothetical protein
LGRIWRSGCRSAGAAGETGKRVAPRPGAGGVHCDPMPLLWLLRRAAVAPPAYRERLARTKGLLRPDRGQVRFHVTTPRSHLNGCHPRPVNAHERANPVAAPPRFDLVDDLVPRVGR